MEKHFLYIAEHQRKTLLETLKEENVSKLTLTETENVIDNYKFVIHSLLSCTRKRMNTQEKEELNLILNQCKDE